MFIRVLLVNLRAFMITQHRNQTKLCQPLKFSGCWLYHLGGKVGMRCYVTDGHVAMKYVVNVTRNKNKTAVTNVTRGTHTSRKYDLVT